MWNKIIRESVNMQYITEGSVCPSNGYLISEQDKELFKLLLVNAKANLNAHSLTKKESVYCEQY